MEAGWLPEMSRNEEQAWRINPGAATASYTAPRAGTCSRAGRSSSACRAATATARRWAPGSPTTSPTGPASTASSALDTQYRNPAFTGDVTYQDGEVVDKSIDPQGRTIVQVRHTMSNQLGTVMARGAAEVLLPAE